MLGPLDRLQETILGLSTEVALACDTAGTIRWADARAARLLAARPEMRFVDLVALGTEDKALRFLEQASAGETEAWELVLVADGRPVTMTWRGTPAPGGVALVGSVVPDAYAAVQENMSDALRQLAGLQRETARQQRDLLRAHAEIEQLLKSERAAHAQAAAEQERLRQVLDRLPEAIVIVDRSGSLAVVNTAARDVLGNDVVGRPMPVGDEPAFGARRVDGSPMPARELPLQRSALRGQVVLGEQIVVHSAGNDRDVPLLINSAPLSDADGQPAGAVAVFQDISAIKELEHQKEEFLATVAHDLKNPLAAIKGWIQILGRRTRQLPEAERERWQRDLGTVEGTATRMAGMIDELLDLTHLQMGRPLELRAQATDLVALARRVAADYQQLTDAHTICVRTALTSLEGMWDQARLERVVGNLISNAVKYSPDGGEVILSLSVEEVADAATAVLSVRDQGIGIPPEDLSRVFERFYRATNVVGRIAGTGIGLAGARQLVEQHGGSMAVESTPGAGSTFVVRLPLGRRGAAAY
jgi:signal transduction histidine kinase